MSGAFTDAAEWVDKTVTATVEWVNNAWDTVNDAFTEAGKWIDKTITSTVNWILGTWDDVKNAIADAAVDTYNSVVNFTLGIVKGVTDFIASIPEAINVVVNFVKGAVTSVTNDSGTFQGGEPSGLGWGESFDVPAVEGWGYNAKGSWSVPRDNYPILAHRGEILLNQSQARRYRDGNSGGGANLPAVIARSVKESMKQVNFLLNGTKVANLTQKQTDKNIRAHSYSTIKAYGG